MIKILAIESYRASIEMAEERGAFPVWNYNNENKNPFINRIFNTINELKYNVGYDLFEKYIKFGRRNIAHGQFVQGLHNIQNLDKPHTTL